MAIMQRYDGVVQDASGNTILNASVQVNIKATAAAATIYSDEGVTPKTNPIVTGMSGRFWFYAADGDYTVTATYGGSTFELGDVTLRAATHVFRIKATDEVVNSNAAQDDDDLHFNIYNGETWDFVIIAYVTTTLAADFRFAVHATGGGGYFEGIVIDGDGTTIISHQRNVVGGFDLVTYTVAPTQKPLEIHGTVTATGDTAVRFVWSQQTNTPADDTKVEEGSFLKAQRVA